MKNSFITGEISITESVIPVVSTNLTFGDLMGANMVRWGINRDNYRVKPGIYAVGNPNNDSDVFVTANYKLSFDVLRKNLKGINGWIMVLDTKGVNVWCAAGKGTFSTKELVNRIRICSLDKIVNHKRLILPQLSATGVAAYKVKEETGFNVQYGPVRASDIKKFVIDGYKAERGMRKVTFSFKDRLKLVPNDFIYGKYYLLGAMAIVLLISCINRDGFLFTNFSSRGIPAIINIFCAYFAGIVITPSLLPYIPGRYFSLKGFLSGLTVFFILTILNFSGSGILERISWFLLITALSSFVAMNFTGSSTYTSLSGVRKEMKFFVPLQIGFALTGIVLQTITKFI